jgi:hypothetical protein
VFGYGSLARSGDGDARPATLRGARRTWGVAMDNRVDLPGYKFYVDRETGTRPALYVAFLDLRPADGDMSGALLPVADGDLPALDDRERNYARLDVTGRVPEAPAGARVWAYAGRDDSRERFRHALATGRACVSREYRDGVLAGFRELSALDAFEASTDPLPCPLRDLERIDLP